MTTLTLSHTTPARPRAIEQRAKALHVSRARDQLNQEWVQTTLRTATYAMYADGSDVSVYRITHTRPDTQLSRKANKPCLIMREILHTVTSPNPRRVTLYYKELLCKLKTHRLHLYTGTRDTMKLQEYTPPQM